MHFRKRLLCMLAYLMITTERTLSYKSGCSGGYCFILSDNIVGETKTQSDAQQWCSNNGSQLIEIKNKDIQNALTNFINGLSTSNGLIVTNGGRQSSPTWSRLSGYGIGSIPVNEQPDATYVYGYLISTSSGFDVYASKPVDSKLGYICSGSQLDCTNGGGVSIDGQCYKSYSNEQLSWYDARNRCLNIGGDLASFDSINTKAGFNALNGSWINPSTTYWIGFRREWWTWQTSNVEVRYSQWSNGRPVTYTNGDPLGCLCLLPYNGYQWTECRCNDPRQFLCISVGSPSSSTLSTTTTTSTTTTPTTTTTATTTSISTTSTVTSASWNATVYSTSGSSLYKGTSAPPVAQDQRAPENIDIPVGVGVGVGAGIILVAAIVVVVVLIKKRCPSRCPQPQMNLKCCRCPLRKEKPSPPDVILHSADEDHYWQVVKQSDFDNENHYANDPSSQYRTVYAQLEPLPNSSNTTPGVFIVNGKDSTLFPSKKSDESETDLSALYGTATRI